MRIFMQWPPLGWAGEVFAPIAMGRPTGLRDAVVSPEWGSPASRVLRRPRLGSEVAPAEIRRSAHVIKARLQAATANELDT